MFHDKFDRLNKEFTALFQMLHSNKPNVNKRPSPNKWSIAQHLYHVWLSESGIEAYIRKKTSFPDTLVSVTPLTSFRMTCLLLIPKLGIKLKAPSIISDPIPDDIDLSTLEKNWLDNRKSFATLFDELDAQIVQKAIFKHPFLGRINMDMTLDFMLFHFRHHKKAITRLLA